MPRARRLRGLLLRAVLNRPLGIALGTTIALPGALLIAKDFPWETGTTDGLALVALGTGVALAWAAITGRRADWQEP